MSMTGYTKLFNSILASTIWRADDKTRIVWITLLAMADKNGVVEGSIPGLADFARVALPDCLRCLKELQEPDEFSRSKESDGRRIEEIDGGWRLINHTKYRNKLGQDERREYLKLKQREYRRKHHLSTNVNNVSDTDTLYTHTSPSPSPKAEATNTQIPSRTATEPPSDLPAALKHYHEGYLARFHEKPNINGGKDGAILKRLLKAHGLVAVNARIDNMLHSRDPFIQGSGCTIGVVSACWNKLASRENATGKTAGTMAALTRFAKRKSV